MNFIRYPISADIEAVKRLNQSDSDELKRQINQTDPTHIFQSVGELRDPHKCKVICPICGNGSGEDHTPVEVNFKDDRWLYNCFVCEEFRGDLLKIIAHDLGVDLRQRDGMLIALAAGADLIGFPLDSSAPRYKQIIPPAAQILNSTEKKTDADELKLILADIADAQKHLADLPESQRRGLSLATLQHFGFGYLAKWTHPKVRLKEKSVPTSRRVIIPSGNHYNAVALPADRDAMEKKFWKMHAGSMELFNSGVLKSDFIVVVEGEIDAASIWQAFEEKISVVATLGQANWNTTLLPKLENCAAGKKFLILFDAEDETRKSAEKLCGELVKRGLPATAKFLFDFLPDDERNQFGIKVDANQLLIERGEQFLKQLIEKILNAAKFDFADIEAQLTRDATFKAKIADWEENNEKISPEILPKIKSAIDYLRALNKFTITAENVQSSKTKHALAMCKFYDCFVGIADNFFTALADAQKLAKNTLKQMKNEGADFVADPPDEIKALANVSVRELKEAVEKLITQYSKRHKNYLRTEAQKKAQAEAEQKQAERNAKSESNWEHLKKLLSISPSLKRDFEIRQLIKELCIWNHDKYGRRTTVAARQSNADLMFINDPALNGLIGYDEFQQANVLLKAPPWNKKAKKGDEWTDADDAQLRIYLRRYYGEFSAEKIIFDSVTGFSRDHSFHEVRDYFSNLPAWDGKPRAETLFIDWLKVADTSFTREVTMKWLLGAVARVFHPGCNFQWSLVIHGNQKIGKGYIPQRLGGKWYKAISDRVDDSHALDTLKLVWIGEFKEMSGMRKADINAIKNFIELSADTRRFAYERRARTVPRQCVFVITVNDDNFLGDLTGNRRFLILHSPLPKFGYVKEVRGEKLSDDNVIAQIWAEVFTRYQELFADGFDERKLELSSETEREGEEIAENYLNDGGLTGIVKDFVDRKILPPVIWELMSREERRNFAAENKFVIEERELTARFKTSHKRISARLQTEFDAATTLCDAVLRVDVRGKNSGESVKGFMLFGTEYRQHICAAEISTEAFAANDKRNSPARINEILAHMDGWHLGKRIRGNSAYGDQKKVYWRNEDNQPNGDDDGDDNAQHASDNNSTEKVTSTETYSHDDDYFVGVPVDSKTPLPFDPDDLPLD